MPETTGTIRLLLIEDSEDDAELVLRAIRKYGNVVAPLRVASEQALRGALLAPWDLVLCDFNLPGFSGLRAFEIVREMHRTVPFIFVSGAMSETQAIDAMRAGARDYVFKSRLERLGPVIERELRTVATAAERDAANRQLLRTSEAHQAMLETLPLPLLQLEADSFDERDPEALAKTTRVVFGNREARKLLWHKHLPLRGPATSVVGDGTSPFWPWLRDALSDTDRANGREVHIRTNHGREIVVLARAESRADARPSLLVSLNDITNRVALERALRDKELTLNILKDTALDGYWDWDLRSGTIEVSARWLNALSALDDVKRLTVPQWLDLMHADDRESWLAAVNEMLQRRQPLHMFMRFVSRSGEARHVLCQGVAQPVAAPTFTRIVGTCTDVTELEAAKASAKKAEVVRSTFLNTMSHEIRTPLNAVLGLSQVLDATPLDAEQRGHVDLIAKSGRHLLSLINDVLDVSRIDSGGLQVSRDAMDLPTLSREVLTLVEQDAVRKGIGLSFCSLLPDGSRFVGDAERVRQVVFNLLSNAVKFTNNGNVRVRLQLDPNDSHFVQISVADTGMGMTEEQQARVFRPFEHGDSEVARRVGGIGLGLSVSRRIAEAMSGRLELTSEVGVGTEVRFLLPGLEQYSRRVKRERVMLFADDSTASSDVYETLRAVASVERVHEFPKSIPDSIVACVAVGHSRELVAAAASQWPTIRFVRVGETTVSEQHPHFVELPRFPHVDDFAQALSEPRAVRGDVGADGRVPVVRVLVAEDNPVNQRVVALLLSKLEVELSIASNGREAIDAVRQADYDLILMDCQMPEVDGWQATSTLREMGIVTPIVALTANVTADARQRCEDVGMNAFLTKPVASKDLRRVIEQWVRADVAAAS